MVEGDGVWRRGWGWADLCVFVVASCRRKGGDGCCKKWGGHTLPTRNHLTSIPPSVQMRQDMRWGQGNWWARSQEVQPRLSQRHRAASPTSPQPQPQP